LQNMCVLGTKIKFTFQLITTQKDFISPTYWKTYKATTRHLYLVLMIS
jgi:hypothetical protein